ncbi:hypothetical protein CTAYLR_001368 [Chrysophaeum taylorii]|uniref:CobW/HypB/UreG nucleotide-binding domain-containing protein n=1 Tax=Chrysophaeum taylorii TaxID=2483200 RepID=A0AAD7XJJ4_9STRA|nr:hypothetical protein CTAYLR_001368 [Chrysophaeum taylorii]
MVALTPAADSFVCDDQGQRLWFGRLDAEMSRVTKQHELHVHDATAVLMAYVDASVEPTVNSLSPRAGASRGSRCVLCQSHDWAGMRVEPAPKQLPFTVLSGFLGAGKTTHMQRVFQPQKVLRVTVIVNDMPAVNVDGALLRAADVVQKKEHMIELTSTATSEQLSMAKNFTFEDGDGVSPVFNLDIIIIVVDASTFGAELANFVFCHRSPLHLSCQRLDAWAAGAVVLPRAGTSRDWDQECVISLAGRIASLLLHPSGGYRSTAQSGRQADAIAPLWCEGQDDCQNELVVIGCTMATTPPSSPPSRPASSMQAKPPSFEDPFLAHWLFLEAAADAGNDHGHNHDWLACPLTPRAMERRAGVLNIFGVLGRSASKLGLSATPRSPIHRKPNPTENLLHTEHERINPLNNRWRFRIVPTGRAARLNSYRKNRSAWTTSEIHKKHQLGVFFQRELAPAPRGQQTASGRRCSATR